LSIDAASSPQLPSGQRISRRGAGGYSDYFTDSGYNVDIAAFYRIRFNLTGSISVLARLPPDRALSNGHFVVSIWKNFGMKETRKGRIANS
jgi:hypothetical protein